MTYDSCTKEPYITHYEDLRDKVIQCVSVFTTHACWLLLDTVGHIKEVICTQRWLQANKKGNCSCIHPWGWRWAAPAVLVLGLSLWVELLQTESETSFFYSHSLKYFSSSKHQKCLMLICLVCSLGIHYSLDDSNIPRNVWSQRFFLPPHQPKEVSGSPILSRPDSLLFFYTLSRSDPQHVLHHFPNDQRTKSFSNSGLNIVDEQQRRMLCAPPHAAWPPQGIRKIL